MGEINADPVVPAARPWDEAIEGTRVMSRVAIETEVTIDPPTLVLALLSTSCDIEGVMITVPTTSLLAGALSTVEVTTDSVSDRPLLTT